MFAVYGVQVWDVPEQFALCLTGNANCDCGPAVTVRVRGTMTEGTPVVDTVMFAEYVAAGNPDATETVATVGVGVFGCGTLSHPPIDEVMVAVTVTGTDDALLIEMFRL